MSDCIQLIVKDCHLIRERTLGDLQLDTTHIRTHKGRSPPASFHVIPIAIGYIEQYGRFQMLM